MKYSKIHFVFYIVILLGCKRSSDPVPVVVKPVITSISPLHGPANSLDTIFGNGFGNNNLQNSVFFNGKPAEIISSSNAQIVAKVPPKAGTGIVSATVNGTTIQGPSFTYDIFTVTVYAGNGFPASIDGVGTRAGIGTPTGVAPDSLGNVYVADPGNFLIKKIAPGAVVTTFAGTIGVQGSQDGQGTSAGFKNPYGVCTDTMGNIYVADADAHTIRKITSSGLVSTYGNYVGGAPVGVAMDPNGNLYVSSPLSANLVKISKPGILTNITGDFGGLWGITSDESGNVYLTDQQYHMIYKLSSTGVFSPIAGIRNTAGALDGPVAIATFNKPTGIARDKAGNFYIADQGNNSIRKISADGMVTTLLNNISRYATNGGGFFFGPFGIAMDSHGVLYVTNTGESTILKITFE